MRWTSARRVLLTALLVTVLTALVAVGLGRLGGTDRLPAQPAPGPTGTATPTTGTAVPAPTTGTATAPTASSSPSLPGHRGPVAIPGAPPPTTRRPAPIVPPLTLDFTISTFNVLGAGHTTPGGSRPRYASGAVRAVGAVELLRRHDADVVGFQELQASQLVALERATDLEFWPGRHGGRRDSENSIGWRRDRWVALERRTVDIPYFEGGPRAMPVVRLRNLGTGIDAWFANFHNPADTRDHPRQQRHRDRATAIEIRLVNTLINRTGLPVLVTGDMNEKAAYFCRFTAGAPMVAARGGSNVGRCLAGKPRAIDWIFGSQGVQFLGYVEDRSPLVDRTTDHPVVSARVRVAGLPFGALAVSDD